MSEQLGAGPKTGKVISLNPGHAVELVSKARPVIENNRDFMRVEWWRTLRGRDRYRDAILKRNDEDYFVVTPELIRLVFRDEGERRWLGLSKGRQREQEGGGVGMVRESLLDQITKTFQTEVASVGLLVHVVIRGKTGGDGVDQDKHNQISQQLAVIEEGLGALEPVWRLMKSGVNEEIWNKMSSRILGDSQINDEGDITGWTGGVLGNLETQLSKIGGVKSGSLKKIQATVERLRESGVADK